MSKKFKCVTGWARHSVGDVIPESEYNRLPFEIKQHGNFEEIPEVIEQSFREGFQAIVVEPKYLTVDETTVGVLHSMENALASSVGTVDVSDSNSPKIFVYDEATTFTEIPPLPDDVETPTFDVPVTVDPFADEAKPKVNKLKKY